MDKSKIFIASSGRTLTLAEKLQERLQTEYSEATLWTEESRRQPGATIIEMLKAAANTYDFAVILLANDDLVAREGADTPKSKARDNCVFEAGLFIAALGRDRCFLVNGVNVGNLPTDLGGIITLPFDEPQTADLSNPEACERAIRKVIAPLKDTVYRLGKTPRQKSVPLLTIDDVLLREHSVRFGGDLSDDLFAKVVVCDLQPTPGPDLACQVRCNLAAGVSYSYLLHGTDDTVENMCQFLQWLLLGPDVDAKTMKDSTSCLSIIKRYPDRILEDLRLIREEGRLQIMLIPDEPQFRFRLHNASSVDYARLFMRYGADGFLLWAEGADAKAVWKGIQKYFPPTSEGRIFLPIKMEALASTAKQVIDNAMDRCLRRCFPGIESQVRELFLGSDW